MQLPLYHTLYYSPHPPSLIVWPKKERLRRITNSSRHPSCLVVFNSLKILWSELSVQLIHSPQFCWFDPFLISFCHRHSPPCRYVFIPLSLQIGTIYNIIFLAIPIRDLMCTVIIAITDFGEPRYLKCSTTSMCTSSTVGLTPESDCIFPTFRSLVFSHLMSV